MQFEAGGQPVSGGGGPITEPDPVRLPDHPDTAAWVDRSPAPRQRRAGTERMRPGSGTCRTYPAI